MGRMKTRVVSEKLKTFQLVLAPGTDELGGPDGQLQEDGASRTWLCLCLLRPLSAYLFYPSKDGSSGTDLTFS